MTVLEYMTTAADRGLSALGNVLAINVYSAASPNGYLVFAEGTAEIKAEILAEMGKKRYVVKGGECRRKFAVRKFTVLMDRVSGEPLQDFLLSADVLFGREQQCVFEYVYFNAATGKGEKGTASVNVQADSDGEAEDISSCLIELYGCGGVPEAYTYQQL